MSAAPKLESTLQDLNDELVQSWGPALSIVELSTSTPAKAKAKSIGVTLNMAPEVVLQKAIDEKFTNICQQDSLAFNAEMHASARLLSQPEDFRQHPISSILNAQNAGAKQESQLMLFEKQFSKAAEKRNTIDELHHKLSGLIKSPSLVTEVCGMVDELYTNAVYNAPFVDPATGFNPGKDRSDESVAMLSGQQARVFVGHDESRLVFGCQDPFGSLNPEKFLVRIRDCYARGVADTMNMGSGGAGIGSFMVFNASISLFLLVCRGKMTMVCGVVPLKLNSRKRLQLPKNLHVYWDK